MSAGRVLMEPYNRLERIADRGVVKEYNLSAAQVEATCLVASQLYEINVQLVQLVELLQKVTAGSTHVKDGRQ